MHTVSARHPFGGDLQAMVAHCRTLDSRASWPGSTGQWGTSSTLYYDVAMRLSAAALTDIAVTEELGPVEQLPDGAVFRTTQRVTWPDGHADATAEYRFTEGTPSALEVTYSYEAPSTRLVTSKQLPAFRDDMQKVLVRYLDDLTANEAPVLA